MPAGRGVAGCLGGGRGGAALSPPNMSPGRGERGAAQQQQQQQQQEGAGDGALLAGLPDDVALQCLLRVDKSCLLPLPPWQRLSGAWGLWGPVR